VPPCQNRTRQTTIAAIPTAYRHRTMISMMPENSRTISARPCSFHIAHPLAPHQAGDPIGIAVEQHGGDDIEAPSPDRPSQPGRDARALWHHGAHGEHRNAAQCHESGADECHDAEEAHPRLSPAQRVHRDRRQSRSGRSRRRDSRSSARRRGSGCTEPCPPDNAGTAPPGPLRQTRAIHKVAGRTEPASSSCRSISSSTGPACWPFAV